MAEYMDISRIDDWDNLSIIDDDGNATYVYDVGELPKADVIECSEYEKLRLVNLDLAETNKALLAEHEQLLKLRSKIDKAILVLKREQNSEFWNSSFRDGVGYALELLKKNLGIEESEDKE